MIRVGISGWRYPPWRGDFYPKGLPQRRELEYAASRLTSIEVNGSFYSLQRQSSWEKWREEVPEDFVFSVKGGRFITHMKRLRDVEVPLANFFAQGVLALGPKLGPILWQLPANFAWDTEVVRDFFALLPRTTQEAARLAQKSTRRPEEVAQRPSRGDEKTTGDKLWSGTVEDRPLHYALEPRNRGFESDEALAVLEDCDVALVVADSAGKFPRFEQAIGPLVYVRLHGDEELYASGYGDAALESWEEKLRGWTSDGRDGFVYFDNDIKGFAPHDAQRLIARLSS